MKGLLERITGVIADAADWAIEHLAELWNWHTERLRESEPYRKALAAGVVAVLAEVALTPAIAAVVTALVTGYAAAYARGLWDTDTRRSYADPFDTGRFDTDRW